MLSQTSDTDNATNYHGRNRSLAVRGDLCAQQNRAAGARLTSRGPRARCCYSPTDARAGRRRAARLRRAGTQAGNGAPVRVRGAHPCGVSRRPGGKSQRARIELWRAQIHREIYRSQSARKMIRVLRETHDTPEAVAHRLARAGGANRFGEPNYRAAWGWNRLAWIGGKFEDRDEHGALLRECIELRFEPKYPAVNRL